MKKTKTLILFIVLTGFTIQAQNMERYVTLGVKKGVPINLQFAGKQNSTKIKIKSGSTDINVEVTDNLSSMYPYIANAETMTIYGDLKSLSCEENDENISSIDVSHNTKLENLYCYYNNLKELDVSMLSELVELECDNNYLTSLDVSQNQKLKRLTCFGNPFTTEVIDKLYCSLCDNTGTESGFIYVLNYSDDEIYDAVIASNKQNAIAKNWKVAYYDDYDGPTHDNDIPETTGTYVCSSSTAVSNLSELNVAIFPNPANDVINLQSDLDKFTVRIYNLQGKLLLEKENSKKISIWHLPAGTYMLEVISCEASFTQKIIRM